MKQFWQFETTYWLDQLNSTKDGLGQKAAESLLGSSREHKKYSFPFNNDLRLFITQFKSPMMLLLIGAVSISAFLGDTSDVLIILSIVLSTGTLSFFQERNAVHVAEKLQRMISIKCNVLRDGQQQQVFAENIVAGDVLVLKAGDMIPADCLIMEANEFYTNESSLTGESYPVRKTVCVLEADTDLPDRINCAWEGTNVVSGNAKVLVITTGGDTIYGSLAQSTNVTVETAFEKGIKDFGYFLMKITLLLSIFILVVNLLNHKNVIESALFALALAVGMAPELLPAITTIAMSAGAKRMLVKKVIVKKLNSIQNLGEINLLCTDKTGTITEGEIKIAGLVNSSGIEDEFVKQLSIWNATFETGYANPIDEALKKLKVDRVIPVQKIDEVPYDFIRKRLSIVIKTSEGNLLISKGAFREILECCTKIRLDNNETTAIQSHRSALEIQFTGYAKKGLRAIGICYKNIEIDDISKEDERELIFAGFILMQDPVKKGIAETIGQLKELQVDLKIISGDNRIVAQSIASLIGIENPVIFTGDELLKTSPEALQQLVKKVHVFAEVEPQQKEHIIQALRKSFTVAYMGDGINDVSAIHAADVGISVENAVDIAREAADFVLMEKNLMVLAEGIKEGRKTFANTLKYIYISTGSTFGNMFSVAAASLLLPFLPMLPVQILLTNFITDFPYLTVTSDNVDKEQLIKPGKWDIKLIRRYMVIFGVHSSIFDILTFFLLYFVLCVKESDFQTAWFIESVLSELFILFIIRTHKSFIRSRPGKYLFIFSIFGLLLTLALPYTSFAHFFGFKPLPIINLSVILLIVLTYIITADLLKVWFFRKYFHEQPV